MNDYDSTEGGVFLCPEDQLDTELYETYEAALNAAEGSSYGG